MQATLTRHRCFVAGSSRPPAGRRTVRPFALFGGAKAKAPAKKPVRESVVPEPSFALPIALVGIAGVSAYDGATIPAVLASVLGAFLALQATRVRFKFDDDALEVVIGKKEAETENVFVGGQNRWKYDTFINWEYWWPGFPVLVYFKESQTKPEGQIHFFPIIMDGKRLYDVMVERCGSSKNSGPKN